MCSFTYTGEAYVFAKNKPLELIDGTQLKSMINAVSLNRPDDSLPKLNDNFLHDS